MNLHTSSRQERLDSLPTTQKHIRILGASGIGWALDAMDVGLISFIMAALVSHWQLSNTQVSLLGSIGFLGMAVGATLGGLLADKYGRRRIFTLTLLIYGLATGASALVTGLGMLLIFRFIVGLGLGAELPVASTLVSEFSPASIRGRMVVILEAFWAVGWICAALIGTFIVAGSDSGWRWALAIGFIPALYSIIIRLSVPESIRFLESRQTPESLAEADSILRELENSPRSSLDKVLGSTANPSTIASQPHEELSSVHSIWDSALRARTILIWLVWFCINFAYYGAFIWIPTLLFAQGFTLTKSFSFTLIMTLAQLPGYAVAAFLIERWGRRATLITFLLGSTCSALFFGLSTTEWQIILAGCLLSFFNLGAWGALYALSPELYPTHLRGTGTGAAAGFGRLASIIAPLSVPFFINFGGSILAFSIFALAFCFASICTFFLPEGKGKSLE